MRAMRESAWQDALIIGIDKSAPVPSPNRSSKSRIGSNPRCAIAIRDPGSDEQCPAIKKCEISGLIAFATVAAARVITPSNTTGI